MTVTETMKIVGTGEGNNETQTWKPSAAECGGSQTFFEKSTFGGSILLLSSLGGFLAGSPSPGALSKMIIIATQISCTDTTSTNDLPFVTNPLSLSIDGNMWAGAVVSNTAFCVGIYVVFRLICFIVLRWCNPGRIPSPLRFPGITSVVVLIFSPNVLLYSGKLLINSSGLVPKLVGGFGVVFSLLTFILVLVVFKCDASRCSYKISNHQSSSIPSRTFFFGVGAWEDTYQASCYVASMGVVFDSYRGSGKLRGRYLAREYGSLPFIVLAAWIPTGSPTEATIRYGVFFALMVIEFIIICKEKYLNAMFLNFISGGANLLMCTTIILRIISVWTVDNEEEDSSVDLLSMVTATIAVSFTLVRVLFESVVCVFGFGRRHREEIIAESNEGVRKPSFRKACSPSASPDLLAPLFSVDNLLNDSICEVNKNFANMEYNLLHCTDALSDEWLSFGASFNSPVGHNLTSLTEMKSPLQVQRETTSPVEVHNSQSEKQNATADLLLSCSTVKHTHLSAL